MPLEFLQQTPEQAFRRIERDLKLAHIDLTKFKRMTPRQLGEAIARIDSEKARILEEKTYGEWLKSENYTNATLLRDALELLKEHKEAKAAAEVLVPGFRYYRGVQQFGDSLQGSKCYFSEGVDPHWINFVSSTAIEKSLLLLEHGTDEDFRKLYIEMADGRIDALETVSIEHITESSPDALAAMEAYCDSQWNGPWPWETAAPLKLHMMIQDNDMKKTTTIREMQARFGNLLHKLNEGEMDQYEVVLASREMVQTVQGMIEDLGKLSGETLTTLKDNIRSAFGDQAAEQFDQAVREPITTSADQLSQLRASMENTVQQLEGGANMGAGAAGAGMDAGMGAPPAPGGDMGAPGAPPMGGVPETPEPSPSALADVNIDGEDVERPMKDM